MSPKELRTDGAINHAVIARQGGIEHGGDALFRHRLGPRLLGRFTHGQDRAHGRIDDGGELRDADTSLGSRHVKEPPEMSSLVSFPSLRFVCQCSGCCSDLGWR